MAINLVRDNSQQRLPQGWKKAKYTTPFLAARGLRGLGDDSDVAQTSTLSDEEQNFVNQGLTVGQADQVIDLHDSGALSDTGYNQIASGNVSSASLQSFLDADTGATTSTTTSSTSTSTSTSTAAVPTGTVVTWQGSLPFSLQTPTSKNSDAVKQALSSQAQAHGLLVTSIQGGAGQFQVSGTIPFTVVARVTSSGFGSLDDVSSIFNGIVYSVAGQMPTNVTIQIVGVAGSGGSTSTFNWTNLSAFLQDNTSTVLVLGLVIFLGPSLIKKL
jgi:hypothetical protein